MKGYDPQFIDGFEIALPEYSAELEGELLRNDNLRGRIYADYINYSLVMNKKRRTPVFVALNINQNQIKGSRRGGWKLDTRVGAENQLDNDYYRSNPWDRGHMARRSTASHGPTKRDAQLASDDTMYYTNACLQHANLNQDEWLALEDWVKDLDIDTDGRITSISGPVYGELNRTIEPQGRPLATIPAGFFKVVAFINRANNDLEVRAFVMYQDVLALKDKQGRRNFNNQTYQVSISEIEGLTGLRFDPLLYEKNVLFYHESPESRETEADTPEAIEVSCPKDIVNRSDEPRRRINPEQQGIYIAAAMINPEGSDRENEWISLINFSNRPVDLTGWTITDSQQRVHQIEAENMVVQSGAAMVITPVLPVMLSNKGSVISVFDANGLRVDRVKYFASQVKRDQSVVFFSRTDFSVTDEDMVASATS